MDKEWRDRRASVVGLGQLTTLLSGGISRRTEGLHQACIEFLNN